MGREGLRSILDPKYINVVPPIFLMNPMQPQVCVFSLLKKGALGKDGDMGRGRSAACYVLFRIRGAQGTVAGQVLFRKFFAMPCVYVRRAFLPHQTSFPQVALCRNHPALGISCFALLCFAFVRFVFV